MVSSRTRAVVALVTSLTLLAAACGAEESGTGAAGEPADAPTDTQASSAAPSSTATSEAPAGTTTTTTTSTTTTTTTTTAPVGTPVASISADEIPALIVEWGDGTGDALTVAQHIIGFPVPVDAPGSTPHTVSVDLRGGDPGDPWRWEWTYEALSSEPIGDIDAELPEGGPGTIETRLTYDAIMDALGWRNTGQVISDPSSGAGGPQSVNFVYQSNLETFSLGGVDTTPGVVRVWAEEDMIFGDDLDPGYQVDVTLDTPADFITVPMIAALVSALPLALEGRLTRIRLRARSRDADSFDAAEGLRYLNLELIIEISSPAGDVHDVISSRLDGTVFQVGAESFFDEGFIQVTEPRLNGDTWVQEVVVLNRYTGRFEVVDDPASGTVSVTIEIRFEPNREVLLPSTD